MSITSAPESAEVMKKVIINRVATSEVMALKGSAASVSKSATGRLSATLCTIGATPVLSRSMAVLPNTVIHRKVNPAGTSSTLRMN